MANEGGANQFQGFGGGESLYGDIGKQMELTREAPMSGAPVAGRAVGAPERQRSARRRAAAGRSAARPAQPSPTGQQQVPTLPIPYEQQIAMIWQQLASRPGASSLIQDIARKAVEQAHGSNSQANREAVDQGGR